MQILSGEEAKQLRERWRRTLGKGVGQRSAPHLRVRLMAPCKGIVFGSSSMSSGHSTARPWTGPLGNSLGGLGEDELGWAPPGSGAGVTGWLDRDSSLIMQGF